MVKQEKRRKIAEEAEHQLYNEEKIINEKSQRI